MTARVKTEDAAAIADTTEEEEAEVKAREMTIRITKVAVEVDQSEVATTSRRDLETGDREVEEVVEETVPKKKPKMEAKV